MQKSVITLQKSVITLHIAQICFHTAKICFHTAKICYYKKPIEHFPLLSNTEHDFSSNLKNTRMREFFKHLK